jgi:diacylglycerol kinase (ATP)
MRVTLLHNPGAGDDDHAGHELREMVSAAGHGVSYASMRQADWAEALDDPGDLLVVAGGDGSVGKVLREFSRNGAPVTLLPLGSANNIARVLGMDDVDAERLVRGWEDGELRRFDVCEARAEWGSTLFVESVGGGLFGEVLRRAEGVEETDAVDVDGDEKVELGVELLREVVEGLEPQRWEIEVDGEDASGDLLAVEVMNIDQLGPNLPLAPDADPGDGFLDLVCIHEQDRAGLLGYLSARLRNLEPDPPELLCRRGRRIALVPPTPVVLHTDDRFWPDPPEGRVAGTAVAQCAHELSVLVPRL